MYQDVCRPNTKPRIKTIERRNVLTIGFGVGMNQIFIYYMGLILDRILLFRKSKECTVVAGVSENLSKEFFSVYIINTKWAVV